MVYELPDPAGSLAIGILSSTITATAANEIKVAVLIACKKEGMCYANWWLDIVNRKDQQIRIAAAISTKYWDQLLVEPTVFRLKNQYNDELKKHGEKLRKRPRWDTDSDKDSGWRTAWTNIRYSSTITSLFHAWRGMVTRIVYTWLLWTDISVPCLLVVEPQSLAELHDPVNHAWITQMLHEATQ